MSQKNSYVPRLFNGIVTSTSLSPGVQLSVITAVKMLYELHKAKVEVFRITRGYL